MQNQLDLKPSAQGNKGNSHALIKAIRDGYNNLKARLGLNTDNLSANGVYTFDTLVNNRQQLEYMYSGSWVARQIIDIVAKDMCKAGVTISGMDTNDSRKIQKTIVTLGVWSSILEAIKWGRLYGGSLAYIMIYGQDPASPLDIDTIDIGQFKGLTVYSRWQVMPSLTQMITDGAGRNEPEFYTSVFDSFIGNVPFTIHHSRVIKFVGIQVPWFMRLQLQFWGQSVLVNLHQRIKSYDMASTLLDQLSNKAFLRIFKIKGLRALLATGGAEAEEDIMRYVNQMGDLQSTEDISVIDADDDLSAITTINFTGLRDMIEIQEEQLSGASGIPQDKLFGRTASGLNASNSGDIEIYHGALESERENDLRLPFMKLLDIISMSTLGYILPEEASFTFDSLYTLDNTEKAEIANKIVDTIGKAKESGLVSVKEAREELKHQHLVTGLWSNLDDKDEIITDQDWAIRIGEGLSTREDYWRYKGLSEDEIAIRAKTSRPNTDTVTEVDLNNITDCHLFDTRPNIFGHSNSDKMVDALRSTSPN